MEQVTIEFDAARADLAKALSACVALGDELWVGGDEGVEIVRMVAKEGGKRYEEAAVIDLRAWFDLPEPLPKPGKKKVPEVDLEGMAFDAEQEGLWLLGSHSWKRSKAEAGEKDADNLKAIHEVKPDGNRFFLGFLPLRKEDGTWLPDDAADGQAGRRAKMLNAELSRSPLLASVREDLLFAPFCDPAHPIAGKDNGLDFEGLVVAPGGRLLVGLRGPVFRGLAVILEIAPEDSGDAGEKADLLALQKIGHGGQRMRRHFLDLAGNGIRELCWDGDELLILAGPTMSLDAPPIFFKWATARDWIGRAADEVEHFAWLESGEIVPVSTGMKWEDVPPGNDHAEAITFIGAGRLLILYDAPSKERFEKPATVIADAIDWN